MANEELIYRITRAVYGRLGAQADERTMENLVTDIYRAIEPVVEGNSGGGGEAGGGSAGGRGGRRGLTAHGGEAEGSSDRLIVSVFGVDNPGIVAGVTQILAESGCSIADINQTVVQGKFAMVIIADSTHSDAPVTALKERFRAAGDKLGVRIYAQREDLFNAMHRI
ncbi:MAG TPA: ACT domain-containing protein [Pyrinomonadaceae bacterium]|nr:ACT domain-containing protein [Pyrinomonadaceae bacterium]